VSLLLTAPLIVNEGNDRFFEAAPVGISAKC
jgi:hypothetical protein